MIVAVVVAAVQADGRHSVRAETNDGGAGLVRRSDGVLGHMNRSVGEVSGVVRVADPLAEFDVEQAGELVLTHDRSANTVSVVDPRTFQTVNTISVPRTARLVARPGGAVIWIADPLSVWLLDVDQLRSITDLDVIEPGYLTEGSGLVTTTLDDDVLVLDRAGERLLLPGAGASAFADGVATAVPVGPVASEVRQLSSVGDVAVLLLDDGVLALPLDDGTDPPDTSVDPIDLGGVASGAMLQQPGAGAERVIVAGGDGSVVEIGVTADGATDRTAPVVRGATAGGDPLAPIVYGGCTFAVGRTPPSYTRICAGGQDESAALTGADPGSLRLRLVNGWIWITDLSDGTMWIAGTDTELERIDDWGTGLGESGDDPDTDQAGDRDAEDAEDEENPDIGEIRAAEIDEDGINEPPVARDDEARTRTDQPVVVDVVANDEDPDGDALMITAVTDVPAGVQVAATADQTSLQVVPAPGATGLITFGYVISDGRGLEASATVAVEVSTAGATSRPPIAVTDIAEVRGGASAAFNVLNNDYDPDGDSFVLESVDAPTGSVVFDPSGEITYTPDPASNSGTVELSYTIVDSFGERSTGVVRVAIRLDTSNNEPDAVNDTAATVVGKPVTFNVMANDTDPDNDPLTIAGLPELVQTDGNPDAIREISLSDDGEFFFAPTVAGDYVFKYSIIDGSERDAAYIRVRVGESDVNRPPVAVRDDVTIGRGDTRNVYVLENDTDPDGDVVGIVDWTDGEGLEVEQVQGLGFRVTVQPGAPEESRFGYSISDGANDPVSGVVVVAVSDNGAPDQPPITRPDTIEVRAGHTTSARVLVNDYDPEGGALRVVGVSDAEGAQLRIGPGGQEVYVSVDPGETSGFTFAYDVADEGGNRTGSLVEVRLVPEQETNRPPVARPDVARTLAGQAIDIPVLINDSDPDGDAIRLESIAAQPVFGTATVGDDGMVRYEPVTDGAGSDRLRYTVVDAQGERAVGDVVIGVLPIDGENRPPTATNDSYTVIVGSDVTQLDVAANDFDPDGDPLAVTSVSGPDAVALDPIGVITFTPPLTIVGASEQHAFTYDIADGRGGEDAALVTIEVIEAAVPLAPIAVDDLVGPIRQGDSVTVNVLANDSDPDGRLADLTVTSENPAAPIAADGTLTLGPLDETTEVGYTLVDADGGSARGLVTVIVVENVAPQVEPLEAETAFETAVDLDVGVQATDPDGDELFFVCCDAPVGGTPNVLASSADELVVQFVPDEGFAGVGSFSYVVDDQNGHSVSGNVQVIVAPQENSPPIADSTSVQVEAGQATPIALDPLASDPDEVTGDVLTFTVDAGGGPVTASGSTLTVDPPVNAAGDTYQANFTVTDAAGAAASGTVDITVTEPNVPPPTAVADSATTNQGQPVILDVLSNDVDPLGDGLRLLGATVTDGSGSATTEGFQAVYTPDPSFFGEAAFTYLVEDARESANGQATGTVGVTVIGRPGAPPTPVASADNATATVTWTLPPSNGAPIDAVELQIEGGETVGLGVVTSHTLDALTNGRPYRFRVRAANVAGWGEWSQFSAAVTPDTEPGRPQSPTVEFGDGELRVSWTPPPNEGSAITGYELEIGGGESAVQELGDRTDYTWTGLDNGINHQFRITAVNASGASPPSAWSAAEHPLREPDAPARPVAARGNRYLDIDWTDAEPNGDPVIEYRIEMRSAPGSYVSVGTATDYRWSNLENGVEQEFRVQARNRDPDWGAWSAWSTPVKPCTVPDRPGAPSATRGDEAATVTYALPDDQGCAIDQVQIRANGGQARTTSTSPHLFDGLTNGTSYDFQVRAQNSEGWGQWSPASNAVTPAGPPIGPGSISGSADGIQAVQLSWSAANPNGTPVTRYELSINNGAPAGIGNVTSYRRTGLADNTTYNFKVRACNAVGCGAYSANRSVRTNGPPAQVGAPSLRVDRNWPSVAEFGLVGSWSAPNNNGLSIQRYHVAIEGGTPYSPGTVTGTSYVWDVYSERTYRVRVRAENAAGLGPWSAWSQITTPSNVSVSASKSGISAVGLSGCTHSSCQWVSVNASGLSPNTTYAVTCHDSLSGGQFSGTHSITTNGSGNLSRSQLCYYGYPGQQVWVFVGSNRSNTITW